MKPYHNAFCSWGMYALNAELQAYWQALHDAIAPALTHYCDKLEPLRFETDEAMLNNPELILGQTCGFPLVTQYSELLTPVCTPVFDVEGCDGVRYSSVLIVADKSDINSLQECASKTVAINSADSNSGMNVLRSMVSLLSDNTPYFGKTLITGGHIDSLRAVAEERADIAAIDCVTFAFITQIAPELTAHVRVIDYSEKTTGLPFVIPAKFAEQITPDIIANIFNNAYPSLPAQYRQALYISEFQTVNLDDYQRIADINKEAQQRNHQAANI